MANLICELGNFSYSQNPETFLNTDGTLYYAFQYYTYAVSICKQPPSPIYTAPSPIYTATLTAISAWASVGRIYLARRYSPPWWRAPQRVVQYYSELQKEVSIFFVFSHRYVTHFSPPASAVQHPIFGAASSISEQKLRARLRKEEK